MKAAAGHRGEFIALLDAAQVGVRHHEGFARFRVGDGVDAANLRALLVGGEDVFFVLRIHLWCSPVGGAGCWGVCVRRHGYYTSVAGGVGSTVSGVGCT